MIISNPALNALLIYLAKHGPLVVPQTDVIAFNGKLVGLSLEQDKVSGHFLVSANIMSPECAAADEDSDAVAALGDAAVAHFVPQAVRNEIEQVKKSLPNNDLFGPSTLFGGPSMSFADRDRDRLDNVIENMTSPPDYHVSKPAVHVQVVTLHGGPSDGQFIALKLPLKRIVFLADKPSHPEVADFEKAHAYMRREDDPRRQGGLAKPAYDYVGFKSREQIKEEYQNKFMDEPDAADWWKGE